MTKSAKILFALVVVICSTCIAGWYFDVQFLRTWADKAVSMKFVTACYMLLSAFIAYSIRKNKELVSFFLSLWLALILVQSAQHVVTENQFFLERAFFHVDENVNTVKPGHPSVVTMFNFFLIVTVGVVPYITIRIIVGWILFMLSMITLVGHAINSPILTGYLEGKSTAMAIPTAICFLLISLILVPKNSRNGVS